VVDEFDKQARGTFKDDVQKLVRQIPLGKVTTYGDLAGLAGHAYAARIVGGIAHFGDPDLPWQRVVNRFGGLASGYPGGRDGHAEHLLQEGITSTNHIVDNFEEIRWHPDPTKLH
jgi:methylated-DNA-protein-cysteine methyltransferase-like protein